jgi:DNA modification methylase
MRTLTIYNLGNLPTAALDDFHELQEDFKTTNNERLPKLQMLIITRGFKYAFKAWKDETGLLWIIDAHQRKKALIELRKAGFDIPPIPYEPIFAENKREAVEEIAAYNSKFATENPDTKLFEKYNIGTDMLERFALDFKPITFGETNQKVELFNDLQTYNFNDNIPEPPAEPVSLTGDLWLLDSHRLFCGDCTSREHLIALMNGRKARLILTDPPYNVAYQGGTKETLSIKNDSMSADDFIAFLRQVHTNLYAVADDGAAAYIFHADGVGVAFRSEFTRAGFKLAQCLVWVKNSIVMGRQDYHWQHEPVLYGWKPTAPHKWHTDRKQSTVLNFDRPIRSDLHPTMKPVELMEYLLRNSSAENEIILDAFGGSGSTLLAAQKNNRIAYLMELDTRYTDVIVHRYLKAFPETSVRLFRNGKLIEAIGLQSIISQWN